MEKIKNLPNLLIVGAAKSGTTSLHNYLKQHPDIFMTAHKEPHFLINNEIGVKRVHKAVTDIKNYQAMFDGAGNYKYRGESSVMYLAFPDIAVRNIRKYLPEDVRIIIMLRNPIERAFAGYLHNVRYNPSENLSFDLAIKASEERYHKNSDITPDMRYLYTGMYSSQIKKYKDEFGDNVHIIIYDDFVMNIEKSIRSVFDFLGVSRINVDTTKRYMVGGWVFNSSIVRKLIISRNNFKFVIKAFLPSVYLRKKIRAIIMYFFTSESPKLKEKDRVFLQDYYKEDIIKTESILGFETKWNK